MPAEKNSAFNRSISFARKLSVIYLFLAAFGTFLLFYYFKFIPDHKSALEDRCYNYLRTLTAGITKKSRDIGDIFKQDTLKMQDLTRKSGSFKRFGEIYEYSLEKYDYNLQKSDSPDFYINKDLEKDFSFHYKACRNCRNDTFVVVSAKDLLGPVFEGHDELFNGYVLLLDTGIRSGNVGRFKVIFQSGDITSSEEIKLDTLRMVEKNSDLSASLDLTFSGSAYRIFFTRFQIQHERLTLAGLMKKDSYSKKVNTVPTKITAFFFAFALLMLFSLPFFKIFLLSPKEHMGFADVIYCSISFFAGSVLVMIGLYSLFYFNNAINRNRQKLYVLTHQIRNDFNNELQNGQKQLDEYERIICNRDSTDSLLTFLFDYGEVHSNAKDYATREMIPKLYRNVERVFWLNDSGMTIAKWNPFNFFANFTSAKGYEYFNRLAAKSKEDTTLVIYPGISNSTGEYQIFIAKRFACPEDKLIGSQIKRIRYSVLAAFFNSSVEPVLPDGYDFSIVDNQTGYVILSSDQRQILQQNLLEELELNNKRLNTSIGGLLEDVTIRGGLQDLMTLPLEDQPFSLVVYYDKERVYDRTLRVLYFATEVMITIILIQGLFLLWYGIRSKRETLLKFTQHQTEWFRVTERNNLSYQFTVNYFYCLIGISLLFFGIVFVFNLDTRIIFLISCFLPLFVSYGFCSSRRFDDKIRTNRSGDFSIFRDLIMDNILVLGAICFLNYIILHATSVTDSSVTGTVVAWVILFESLSLALLVFFLGKMIPPGVEKKAGKSGTGEKTTEPIMIRYLKKCKSIIISWFNKPYSKKVKDAASDYYGSIRTYLIDQLRIGRKTSELKQQVSKNYFSSLLAGMILVSIIPTFGIFLYAVDSERMQQTKLSQLVSAEKLEGRIDYINNKMMDHLENELMVDKSFKEYFQSFKKDSGIYLAQGDHLAVRKLSDLPRISSDSFSLYDNLYSYLLNLTFPFASGSRPAGNIPTRSPSQSWAFRGVRNTSDTLYLTYPTAIDSGFQVIFANSFVRGSLQIISFKNIIVGFFILSIIILFILACRALILKTVSRLFLADYFIHPIYSNPERLDRLFGGDQEGDYYFKEIRIDEIKKSEIFRQEAVAEDKYIYNAYCNQEEFILANQAYFEKSYERIWDSLDDQEKYVTYDICTDGYTNYKDLDLIYKLENKGILVPDDFKITPFSKSFHNYVLGKKGTREIKDLFGSVSVAGNWEAFLIPVLIMIAIIAIFLLVTQDNLVHQITALITSLGATLPLLGKLVERIANKALPK